MANERIDLIMAKRMLRSETCLGQVMVFVNLLNLLCSICRMGIMRLCFMLCHDYRLNVLAAGALSYCI